MKRTISISKEGLKIIELLGGIYKLNAMLGVKNLVFISFGLQFQIKVRGKANFIRICVNDNDLYDIEFGNIKGTAYLQKSKFENIFFDDLRKLIESETGLYLSL